MRKQACFLNHISHAPTQLDRVKLPYVYTAQVDGTACWLHHAIGHAQQGCLAGTAAAEDRSGGALFELECNCIKQQTAFADLQTDIAKLNGCRHGYLPFEIKRAGHCCPALFISLIDLAFLTRGG